MMAVPHIGGLDVFLISIIQNISIYWKYSSITALVSPFLPGGHQGPLHPLM